MLSERLKGAFVTACVLCLFAFRCLGHFVGAGHDDTFITLLAAEQLADGQGFITPSGEPGEIGSSLLHVVILALFRKLGAADLYLTNKTFGWICGATTLALIVKHRETLFAGARATLLPATLATSIVAWWPTYAFWTMGGLETPLVGLLVTALALSLIRQSSDTAISTGVLGVLITMVRPEGFTLLAAVAACGIALRRTKRWWLHAMGIPVFAAIALLCVRWLCFGALVPLPVLAKTGGGPTLERLAAGLAYVAAFGRASPIALLTLVAFIARAFQLSRITLRRAWTSEEAARFVPAVLVAASLGTTAIAGGDWMAYYRFMAPIVPLLAVLGVQWPWEPHLFQGNASRTPTWLTLLLLAGTPLVTREQSGLSRPYMHNTCLQRSWRDLADTRIADSFAERVRSLNHPYWRDRWQLRPFLLRWLAPALKRHRKITLATHQMGFLPYELRLRGLTDVELVDTLGIVDPRLAHLPGPRTPLGLAIGLYPERYLDPSSRDAVASAIQSTHPDLVYVLQIEPEGALQLRQWGWKQIWNAPEAKLFARASFLDELRRKN